MPLDLASLLAREATLEVAYAGEVLRVQYRPAEVTGRTQRALAQAGRDGEIDPLLAELARILVTWDLTADGAPVPTTADALAALGLGLTMAVLQGVLKEVGNPTWAASPPSLTRSPNGSSPTANWAGPPTTSGSSSTPAGPASLPGPWRVPTTPTNASAGAAG